MTRQAIRKPAVRSLTLVTLIALVLLPRPLLAGQRLHSKESASGEGNQAAITFMPAVAYDVGGSYPNFVAVADMNGDGKPDLVVTVYPGAVAVLLGNGDGTFQPASTYAADNAPSAVIIADLNGDGKPDVVVCGCITSGCSTSGISVLLGNGDGTLQPPYSYISDSSGAVPLSLAAADLNGDGELDVVVSSTGGNAGVFLGNGDGTFQPVAKYVVGENDSFVAIADLNHDGKPDIVVGYTEAVAVLLGNGDGTFQPGVEYPTTPPGTLPEGLDHILVADVNGDGKPDVVVSNQGGGGNYTGSMGVLLGNGDGTLQPVVDYGLGGPLPWGFAYTDLDGDGTPDLAVANYCVENQNGCYGDGSLSVMRGNGNGTFQPPITVASGTNYLLNLAAADLNGDGRPDLVLAPWTVHSVGVFINTTGKQSTTTTLASAPNPSGYLWPATFTATVGSAGGAPPNGESVTFYNGQSIFGTASLNGGVASLTTSALPAGESTITASYAGDSDFIASTSNPITQHVVRVAVVPPPHR